MECALDEAQSATGFGVDLGDVRFLRKLGGDGDSKLVFVVSSRDVISIHGIGVDGGLPFSGNQDYCTFVDIKVHLPHLGPLNESVQVTVQNGMIVWRQYLLVYYAVISMKN